MTASASRMLKRPLLCCHCHCHYRFKSSQARALPAHFLSNVFLRPLSQHESSDSLPGPTTTAATWDRKRLLQQASPFIALSKPRLTMLITLTAMSSYAISPLPLALSSLVYLTAGTLLTSTSANALNQRAEPDFDASMTRTSMRPIVRGRVSKDQAFNFACATGVAGTGILALCNPLVAGLGAANIFLYAYVYTPLKRRSIVNTWVGSVVGAVPPLMGWSASGASLMDPGAWCLAGMLYAWQFPHFNSLAWVVREDYARAGYKMMVCSDPQLTRRVSLRYALLLPLLCIGLVETSLVHWSFLLTSAPVNYLILRDSIRFYYSYSTKEARKLFWVSVVWLPAVLTLAMVHKTGIWEGLFAHFRQQEEYLE